MNAVTDIPRDTRDRDRIREEWRLLAVEHVELDQKYQELKDGLDVFYSELIDQLMDQGKQKMEATRIAKSSKQYRDYLRRLHNARFKAKMKEVELKDADRKYWENVSIEAKERAEMRMSR